MSPPLAPAPVAYLSPNDQTVFGVPSASVAQVQQATALINGYLGRPEGLIWSPDFQGLPCWMAGLTAQLNYINSGTIAPGANVVVPISNFILGLDQVGRVLVLDRSNKDLIENAVITAVTPANKTITLDNVQNAHAANCGIEYGLIIQEERALPSDRPMTRTARFPVARLVALQGRYAFQRRSEQASGYNYDFNLLSTIATFGGPPLWLPIDPSNTGMEESTGDIWPPAGPYIASYSEVRIHYIAGWPANSLPNDLKQACASIIQNIQSGVGASPDWKSFRAGGTAVERFGATFFDTDTKNVLSRYKLRAFI